MVGRHKNCARILLVEDNGVVVGVGVVSSCDNDYSTLAPTVHSEGRWAESDSQYHLSINTQTDRQTETGRNTKGG